MATRTFGSAGSSSRSAQSVSARRRPTAVKRVVGEDVRVVTDYWGVNNGWRRNCPTNRRFPGVQCPILLTNHAYSATTPPLSFTTSRTAEYPLSQLTWRNLVAWLGPSWSQPTRKPTPELDRCKAREFTDARIQCWSVIAQHRDQTALTVSSLTRNIRNSRRSDGAVNADESARLNCDAKSVVLISHHSCLSREPCH
jgi:hypothetical protein